MDSTVSHCTERAAPETEKTGGQVLDTRSNGSLHVHLYCIDWLFLYNVGRKIERHKMTNRELELEAAIELLRKAVDLRNEEIRKHEARIMEMLEIIERQQNKIEGIK